jgi:methionyl-tRNA synthetase
MHPQPFYITTSLPYVNAAPHLGFALELAQADAFARFHRLLGDDTWLLTDRAIGLRAPGHHPRVTPQ